MVFALKSTNKSYDAKFLQNYANINLVPVIKRINGVGEAQAWGTGDYSMRIWLKPDVMAVYNLVPDDITNALAEQNIEAAPGKLGENNNQSFEYVLKYKGRLEKVEEYENIVIRSAAKSQILRLKDVARIELGSITYNITSITDGEPSIVMGIFQSAGSNAHEMIGEIDQKLDEAAKSFPPGVRKITVFSANDFLNVSIEKVITTLVEAFILVFIVVFIFLQDLRSTLIPAIAVPVAIIGTFSFYNYLDSPLTCLPYLHWYWLLVLWWMILWWWKRCMQNWTMEKVRQGNATLQAMSEISGAVISITLVMSAVFLPVTFIKGSTGIFYKQFGLTLAVSIIISAVNALTLSPALCALLLKNRITTANCAKDLCNVFMEHSTLGLMP